MSTILCDFSDDLFTRPSRSELDMYLELQNITPENDNAKLVLSFLKQTVGAERFTDLQSNTTALLDLINQALVLISNGKLMKTPKLESQTPSPKQLESVDKLPTIHTKQRTNSYPSVPYYVSQSGQTIRPSRPPVPTVAQNRYVAPIQPQFAVQPRPQIPQQYYHPIQQTYPTAQVPQPVYYGYGNQVFQLNYMARQ